MLSSKRVIVASIFGLISGLICWQIASMESGMPWAITVSIILSRTLMGFGIGISNLRLSWWLHGIVLGIIFSVPMAFSTLVKPETPEAGGQSGLYIFLGTLVLGAIYGLIVELFTTVIFKAKPAWAE